MKTPTITGEKTLKQWRFLHLKEQEITHGDGGVTHYEVVSRIRTKVFWIVTILPITENGEIIMIRQYRIPLDRIQLELPAWCAEVGKHETLQDAVQSELYEETGYVGQDIRHIAEFSSSSGMTDETVHGYVATNCQKASDILTLDRDEYIEKVIVPYTDFDRYIASEIARNAIIEPKMLAMMLIWRDMFAKNSKVI